MKQIVVIGAGGLGIEIVDAIATLTEFGVCKLAGVLDDVERPSTEFPYLGLIDSANVPEDHYVILGVGDPALRHRLAEWLGPDVRYASVIHPTAVISPRANVGTGTFIAPFSYVGPRSEIGRNCVLNVYSSVGHDATLAENVVLSPYATLNGGAFAGAGSFFGTRASAGIGVNVGPWSKIAASTVASRSCETGSLVAGNPAKSRVMFRSPAAA